MSGRSKRLRIPVAIVFLVVLFGIVIQSFIGVRTITGDGIPFLAAFIHGHCQPHIEEIDQRIY